MNSTRAILSTLWIFASLNYLYCDVVTLMDSRMLGQFLTGHVGGMDISAGFLLAASALVEIPIAMAVAARLVTRHGLNRWANVTAAAVMTIVQSLTLFTGTPTGYYVFFSVIEISCTLVIGWLALRWRADDAAPRTPAATVALAS
ncbi:DUF6326 family protein [Longispora albida]|uniref:DUF6326 family protein n=1 Tax=Longispora albida TaxID=203523 RepID=UPI0003613EBC|nr:DUF6326 family protein [Longispora albida]